MKEQKKKKKLQIPQQGANVNNGNGHGFIMLNRSDTPYEVIAKNPMAWCLLSIIGLRAWRGPLRNRYGCATGEAFIGDFRAVNFTEKEYRVAKKTLEQFGLCSFRATNKGTIAKLLNTDVFSINADVLDEQGGHEGRAEGGQGADKGRAEGGQRADEGRAEGGQGATNNKSINKEGNTEKKKQNNTTSAAGAASAPAGAGSSGNSPSGGSLEEVLEEPEVEQDQVEDEAQDQEGIPGTEEEEMTPDKKVHKISGVLPKYVKRVAKLNQLPVFTQFTHREAKDFFSRNKDWEWWDILAVCALGIKTARENPPPGPGKLDLFFCCRSYAHKPNMLFDTVKGGRRKDDLILCAMQAELMENVGYARDEEHDWNWLCTLIAKEYQWVESTSEAE